MHRETSQPKYTLTGLAFSQRNYSCLLSRRAVAVLTTSETERNYCYHIIFLRICYEELCKKMFTLYLHFTRMRQTFWPGSVDRQEELVRMFQNSLY